MKKEIIFVTTNKGKIASAQQSLEGIKVTALNAELIEPRSDDIREISAEKVKQAYELTKKPCIALDSGFFIEAWHGFPRAYVNPTLETLGIEGILKLMDNIDNRSCKFTQCVAYYDGMTMQFFESESPGKLSTEISGDNTEKKWSELWYIFKPLTFEKTLAQFDDSDFEAYHQQSKPSALKLFGDWYRVR